MAIEAEQLAALDEELAALGRSDDQIESVLARFEDREPEDLAEVDAQLERLAADVASIEGILEGVRERVASAITHEAPAVERAAVEEPAPAVVEAGAAAEEAPAAEEPAPAPRLSADDLFGDDAFGDERPSSPDFAAMFGEEGDEDEPSTIDTPGFGDDFGLADSLEAELEGIAAAAARADEVEDEGDGSTSVFSSDDIDAIQEHAMSSAAPPAMSSPPPVPSEPARRPSQHPRDPDIDALLGDDERAFRPSQHPPTAEADAEDGEFELLVDEDLLLEEDEEYPEEMPTSVAEPAFLADLADEAEAELAAQAASEGAAEDEAAEKKGFFKKLFGGGD